MHKNRERVKKLHTGSGKRMLVAGTLAIFFATVLVMSVLQMNSTQSEAKGGAITGSSTDGDTFWKGISSPNDLVITQTVTVTDENLKTSSNSEGKISLNIATPNQSCDTFYGNVHNTSINRTFAVEGKFNPTIKTTLNNNYTAVGKSNTWFDYAGAERYYSYLNMYGKTTYTYYVTYTDDTYDTGVTMGMTLLEYYKQYYCNTHSEASKDMMITTEEQFGKALNETIEACAKYFGWKKYTGSPISLYQDGVPVKRIEMLTATPVDFWYGSYKIDETGYNSNDLDFMLYTSHNYNFTYSNGPEKLNPPKVDTESKTPVSKTGADAISVDDMIILSQGDNATGTAKQQYYFSNSVNETVSSGSWSDYSEPVSPNGNTYLYVRNNYADGNKNYFASDVDIYKFSYLQDSQAIVKSSPENGESVDAGDTITLSQQGAADGSAIFYVMNASEKPTLSRVSYAERQSLSLDSFCTDGVQARTGGNLYIKINEIWYKCSNSSVEKYVDPVVVGDDIRQKNSATIYAFVVDNGKEHGDFQVLRYSYNASGQTEAPESTVATSASSPTTVKLGDMIGLLCNTPGSDIFYTVNGSAPVIVITENGPEPGVDYTFKYTEESPVVVNDSFAEYGKTFLLMAQAVNYVKIDDTYYCVYQDSNVSKFTYKVEAQTPVEPVQSVPKTNNDQPVEVQVGDKIQLYSDTSGVTIFYTIDGSEPTFEEGSGENEGKLIPGKNTFVYDGKTGVVVPIPEDNSMLTITAIAYKEELAVSDIVRLIFAYPGSVSSPYANPAEGAVTENTEVILKTATDGAEIYYEVAEGDKVPDEPTITTSRVFDETNPIKITKKTTIKAIAVKDTIESPVVTLQYTVSSKLKTPTPSIDTGAVISSGTVISLSAESGATIYYTLDGSDPRDPENKKVQVGNQAVINGKSGDMIVLRAYAAKNGYSNSEVGTYSYSLSAYAGGIYADREDGEILKNGEVVNLHTDMSNADIYYTTDGSAPSKDSHKGSSVTIHGNPGEKVTVMAIAIAKGSEKSTSFATFTYTIMDKLSAPTSSVPDGAIFTKASAVELKAEKGRIYYTTDGTEPTTSSNLYKKSIVIEGPVTIKAMVVAEDLEQSDVSTFTYGFAQQVAAPIASYASGELEMGTKVTFSCETEGATIYYRTDGKDINLARKNELEIYKEPITINQATNFKVIAVKDKMQDSNVLKVGYTVKEPVVIEAVEEETSQNMGNQSNRLQSRRSFSDTESGPSYTDVILKNASYGAVVAAEEGTLPDQVQLVVQSTNVTDAVNRRVKQVLSESFGVVASYDVRLLVNGEETQPEGTIEIGLPIPVEYENAMIYIIHVQEDGNIELYETRRSGGVAYAKVDHLSIYSITASVEFDEEKAAFPWLPIIYTLAVGFTGLGIGLIYKAKKQRREEVM